MDPVVHFEIPADDVARAQAFYTTLFGWKANSVPGMGYTLFHTTPTDSQGMVATPGNINGGMLRRQPPIERIVITVQVADIDGALRRAVSAGGRVLRDKASVPGVGYAAYVEDTEGNPIGLIQPGA